MQKSAILPASALLLVCATAQPALADAKDEFQKGCESGHGSFVENVDNVQCNTSGGLTITCDKSITKCSVSAQIIKPIRSTLGTLKAYMTRAVRIPGWRVVPAQSNR
jgi:hypothetical protein